MTKNALVLLLGLCACSNSTTPSESQYAKDQDMMRAAIGKWIGAYVHGRILLDLEENSRKDWDTAIITQDGQVYPGTLGLGFARSIYVAWTAPYQGSNVEWSMEISPSDTTLAGTISNTSPIGEIVFVRQK
jgi:hypothetical protein